MKDLLLLAALPLFALALLLLPSRTVRRVYDWCDR